VGNFDEPKGFAFGDLNAVGTPRTQKKFDSKHTSALGAIREVIYGHYTPDALANTGPYKGVVLRVEEDMDQNNPAPGNWLARIFGEQGMFGFLTVPKKLKQYKVRVPELHSTLPIPTRFASSPTEVGDHQKTIDMYPTFVAKDSNAEQAVAGDLVWVDFGHKGNMDDPTFIGPVFPPPDGGGNGGNEGGSGSDAFSNCGGASGAGGFGPSPGGGALSVDQRNHMEQADAPWANAMYLSSSEASTRNSSDPMKGVVNTGNSERAAIEYYVKHGGSGAAVSGRVALGSCAGISNPVAKYLTALRIATEDQADRGYAFGGKCVNRGAGGVDCSGFVKIILSMTEFLVDSAGSSFNLLPREGGTDWRNFCDYGMNKTPMYGTTSRSLDLDWKSESGYDWFDITAAAKDGTGLSGDDFINYLDRTDVSVGVNYWDVDGAHLMPGDVVWLARDSGSPDWAQSAFRLEHILNVFTDPNGELRIAESGGPFGGTGSRTVDDWLSAYTGWNIYVWQPPHFSALWAEVGGRPTEKWTADTCRSLAGDEYFSAPEIGAGATGDGNASEAQVDGSASGDAVQQGTDESGTVTAENITAEQANAVALSDEERAAVTACSDSTCIAATAAGQRAIEQSSSETETPTSTPAEESTAAEPAATTPQSSAPPTNCGGGSGGGGGGSRSAAIGALGINHSNSGTPIGDVPFVGTTAADPFSKMGLVEVPMDLVPEPGKSGTYYSRDVDMREDVAPNVAEVVRILHELGGLIPSSGASRNLDAAVTPGRSATSFHYTSAALDILLPGMMSRRIETTDPFVVEFDPSREGKFIVWARSTLTSGSVSKAGATFEVEHKTLRGIRNSRGEPPTNSIVEVTGYFVNLTKIMWAHGLKDIGATSSWYRDSGTGYSEAWHFDQRENMGLVTGQTRFDDVLKTIHEPGSDPPWASGAKTWNGGSFS